MPYLYKIAWNMHEIWARGHLFSLGKVLMNSIQFDKFERNRIELPKKLNK